MRNLNIFFVLFLVLLTAACSQSMMVNSDRDTTVNLRNYGTFMVNMESKQTTGTDPILNSEINRKRIATAIRNAMVSRGYVAVEKDPDLVIDFATVVKDRQEVQTFNNGYWGYWWWARNNNYVRNYEESTLVIDVNDGKTKQMLWQGWAVGEVNYSSKNMEKRVAESIMAIFRDFPMKGTDTQVTSRR